MDNLSYILIGVSIMSFVGKRDLKISGIAFDSREVKQDYLFVAIKGLTVDGHDYIDKALKNGAVAIVSEIKIENNDENKAFIQTDDSSKSLAYIAGNFYDNPSRKLNLIGITGTNGKTTTATLSFDLFRKLGYKAGLISTVENKINDRVLPSKYTTPDAIELNKLLVEMLQSGCSHVFMEVSSHALSQNRVLNIEFKGGVFTNITHDHLDYHSNFDEYIKAKKLLFDGLNKESFALVNKDEKHSKIMIQNTQANVQTYALKSNSDFKGKILHNTLDGLELEIDNEKVWFQLIGSFNAYNLLSVYAIAMLLGEDKNKVLKHLSSLKPARGRFEKVSNKSKILAIVDYAHTPDALQNVLDTITNLRTGNEQIITVVGCGGNRDKTKRPKMAEIAETMSNKVILTSDNPRNEKPEEIINDMIEGLSVLGKKKAMIIIDRKEAIKTACMLVQPNDIVLVAGKGHENYQEINGVRHHFDDKEILNEFLNI